MWQCDLLLCNSIQVMPFINVQCGRDLKRGGVLEIKVWLWFYCILMTTSNRNCSYKQCGVPLFDVIPG